VCVNIEKARENRREREKDSEGRVKEGAREGRMLESGIVD
jgi:hypothetical protein